MKTDKRKNNRGNAEISKHRPDTPREKKYTEGVVMLSMKFQPSTAEALRSYAKNSFPKPKGGYNSLVEQLIRAHFGLDTLLDFPPDDDILLH